MRKKIQTLLKNEKGFTLVELLAVIVILGIIAAIAIPSIANIIDNSKKDAHVANAEQLVGAARMAVAANDKSLWLTPDATDTTDTTGRITMKELIKAGYLESEIEDPDDNNGTDAATRGYGISVVDIKTATDGKVTYEVYLQGDKRTVGASKTTAILSSNLDRKAVYDN